ncbi:ShlB/FhaC/HecB family hemolysin secretion/activation protein [Azospirillum sp. RWY-5-1]|uniref:ShlB/FhaC/HecB family hemolysin secretion/activation protein n=2 Tax=Azospirillum oleiclasticum TaxID=2735135 RepID=A0ABX2TFQ4_9PROT|nr:ShlB/FhaC/HecB family hemolysin secretion/activation protein [Azospirillum oleiclasticum]NYZ22872.1 ShlB/FhaC/HecB family hemolysin secretion/activation protein [Azospirillum oleiclasticum]
MPMVPAMGQVPPNAGSLQRMLRDGVPDLAPQRPPAAPAEPEAPPDTGPRLLVKGFVIDGATLIPQAELQTLLSGRVGKEQSLRDLQDAARSIADAYRVRGYFARAFLPAQDVTDGIVRIQVVEGRFGRVIRQDEPTRADGTFVESVVAARLKPGEPYSLADLERGLLLANDLPGISADGTLKAGAAPGTSDLTLAVRDTPVATAQIGADNAGTRSTSLYRANAGLSLNGLTGYGDQLAVRTIASTRLTYGQAGWSVPLGPDGWQAGLLMTALRYRLGGSYEDTDGRGVAITQSASITYPLIRSSTETLRLRAAYEHGRFDDDILGEPLHRKRINKGRLALVGDRSDGWGGGGLSSYQLVLTSGVLDLSRLDGDLALDELSTRSDGRFTKLTFEFQRDQALATDLFLRARIAGQWSGGNLDSSEQFSLGGPGGVRAYPVNEAPGDSGLLATLELHRPFADGWASGLDLFGFVDAGAIRQHADRWDGWDAGSDIPNSYPLFGAGVGASYAVSGRLGVTVTAAVPVGANQGAATAG